MAQKFSQIVIFFTFIYLVTLRLSCCTQAFPSCEQWGLVFVGVCGLLAVASLVAEPGSRHTGFSSCSMWAQSLWLTGPRESRLL